MPNGGTHNARTGRILNDEGRSAGFADLLIFLPDFTLAAEMKTRTGGRLSPEQAEWGRFLGERPRWEWRCFHGAKEAIDYLVSVLS